MELTDREIIVLRLNSQGYTQKEIAKRLRISQPAVSKFYNNAQQKIKDAKEILKIIRGIKK